MLERNLDNRGGGGFRDALRRVFGEGDNPLTWSVPLYRLWGISVRIHLVFALYIVSELFLTFSKSRPGFWFRATELVSLFGLVLLHEYGHCFACRRIGGEADRILLWPLGGLASCLPPEGWRASLMVTIGGPAVNLVLWPVFGAALLILCGPGAVFFNPFDIGVAWQAVQFRDGTTSYWLYLLWYLYLNNAALFLFNMLVPMYPMDCGRIVHALIWRRAGYKKAMEVTVIIGFVAAGMLFMLGLTQGSSRLMALAAFGAVSCWFERSMLKMRYGESEFPDGYAAEPTEAERPDRRALKRREQEEAEQRELDRILEKIAQTGMASLTGREKRFLKRTTEQRQRPR